MKARSVARVVVWPLNAVGVAAIWIGRYVWYVMIAGSPPLMAFWLMKHVDHHKDEEEKS